MRERVAGVVLCGGRSTRMRRSKALLPFGDEVLLERVVRIVGSALDPVIVVAAPGQELPTLPPKVGIVRDEREGMGPLAGIAAGLHALENRADAAYVSSCDVPLLRPEFIRLIVEKLGRHELAIPREERFFHPLAAIYRVSILPKVRRLIAADRLRPFFLLEECDAREIDVEELRRADPDLDSLRNANTPDDYRAVLARAGLPSD